MTIHSKDELKSAHSHPRRARSQRFNITPDTWLQNKLPAWVAYVVASSGLLTVAARFD